jgi:hypothetical protein
VDKTFTFDNAAEAIRYLEVEHAGYEAAKRVYELGQAVRARRLEVGMS